MCHQRAHLQKQQCYLKQQLESSKKQLRSAHCVLRDITNEKLLLKKQREISEKKLAKSKELQSFLEEEVSELHEQNIDLSMALSALESELSDDTVDTSYTDDENFTFQTKLGRRYSPSIRKLVLHTIITTGSYCKSSQYY